MTLALMKPFTIAVVEWRRAYAEVAALDVRTYDPAKDTNGEYDKVANDALERMRMAEWTLVQTPAKGMAEVRERAAIVQDIYNRAATMGEPSDNVHRQMLDTLIAEIMAPID
jgi:hypothetical protein